MNITSDKRHWSNNLWRHRVLARWLAHLLLVQYVRTWLPIPRRWYCWPRNSNFNGYFPVSKGSPAYFLLYFLVVLLSSALGNCPSKSWVLILLILLGIFRFLIAWYVFAPLLSKLCFVCACVSGMFAVSLHCPQIFFNCWSFTQIHTFIRYLCEYYSNRWYSIE